MLLAAGRGQRMRPLTDTCPKPLLSVQGQPLLQWHLQALAQAGITRVLVNTAWLGQQIAEYFGEVFSPDRLSEKHTALSVLSDVNILYSDEGRDFGTALETAGGIVRAYPMLDDVFWVLAGDVYTPGFPFSAAAVQRFTASDKLAHLWLLPNPAHNPRGDFGWDADSGLALNLAPDDPRPRWTYSTIGLYRRALFAQPWCPITPGNPLGIQAALAPLLRRAMDQARVSAELYQGAWTDVGTPERLAQLNTFT